MCSASPIPCNPSSRRCGASGAVTWSASPRSPAFGAYCASKAAAINLLESLRVELRGSGVAVTTLAPGYIATPMTRHNPYRMPFILDVDTAVERMARAIERGAAFAVVPWQMALVARLMKLLPDPLYDALFARAGRKPRGLPP